MGRRYVVVGSGVAGLAAVESIRREDPFGRITMLSAEPHPFYSRPGLAYLLSADIPERQLGIRTPEELRDLRFERLAGRAARVCTDTHELEIAGGGRLAYDRLLIATGATSIAPGFPGADLEGVVRLDGLDDARRIIELTRTARSAVVIGGGSTALELVEGIHVRGVHTHYLMRGARYWSRVLDPTESDIVESQLEDAGVVLHRHTEIRRAVGRNGRIVAVETSTGEKILCDLLAVAVGVRPSLELARASGIMTDRGIATDEYLETSTADVFAAGDVAQVRDPDTGVAMLDTLWNSAHATGLTAGRNMAGGHEALRRRPPLNVTRIGGLTTTIVGAVGGSDDPDLLTLTRGQSERWTVDTASWTLADQHTGDRIRVLVGPTCVEGAVIMGDQALSRPLARLIAERVDLSSLRPALEARPHAGIQLLTEFLEARDRSLHAARA